MICERRIFLKIYQKFLNIIIWELTSIIENMENKTTEGIPGLATDAVLVQSQEMPKNSEVCKGNILQLFISTLLLHILKFIFLSTI